MKALGKQLQIVIIEDDPVDAARLKHELERCGLVFQSVCVTSRGDFMQALEQKPDLVLSDHGLPSFDGFTALSILQEQCPRIPFIFVTGWYDQGLVVEIFDSGAAGYVCKNRLSDLGPVIRQALAEDAIKDDPVTGQAGTQSSDGFVSSTEVKTTREVRVICSQCKKVRSEKGDWEPIEACFDRQRQITMTLGTCPHCALKRTVLSLS